MKTYSLFPLVVIVLFISCSSNDDKRPNFNEKFKIIIFDTVAVPIKGKLITAVDHNNKNGDILLCDLANIDTIYLANKKGYVKKKVSLLGQDANRLGSAIFNIGFLGSDTIVVNSERGFFYYNLSWELQRSILDKTTLLSYGAGIIPRIRQFKEKGKVFLIQHLKPSFEGPINSEHGYNNYKSITIYDINNKSHKFIAGYEKESIFQKEKMYFGSPLNFFDIDKNSRLQVIHNPDLNLYEYDIEKPNNPYLVTKLYPAFFQLNIKYGLNENIESKYDDQIINSQFVDLNCFDRFTFLTYRTGIPVDIYKEVKSSSELPELFKAHMKYYVLLLKDGKQVCADILLPKGVSGIAFIKSSDDILLNTNPMITETESSSIFYRAKLVRIK
ncbi:hypothetical protein IC229_30520 [Spirosoma sp. BT702]|uniref:DUF4221 domain-containing protein n=1 Tax=Spirosoma profusum TaxID=2771354 RepID=A0A927AV57_9BACT|nr:hypothetical protein [Spirosoma profusum]MBD2705003.1 hypothetical protein [Spirosoma profusum]